jgi:hypothetical protein
MTATQLRYRRYLKQTRSTRAIAAFFREYPQFRDCEFTFTDRSVTIFAKQPNADLADICEIAGFDLVVDRPDPHCATSTCIEAWAKVITMILISVLPLAGRATRSDRSKRKESTKRRGFRQETLGCTSST